MYASNLLSRYIGADVVPDGYDGIWPATVRAAHSASGGLVHGVDVVLPACAMKDVSTSKADDSIASLVRGHADATLGV